MKHILFILFSLLFFMRAHSITVTTQTHYYITCEESKDLIIIERRTGIEKRLTFEFGLPNPLQIQSKFGYLSSDKIYKIDLQTHTIVATLETEDRFNPMVIHGEYGFVKLFYKRYITVVHLPTFTKVRELSVHHFYQCQAPILISGEKGYCVYDYGYYVLDLTLKTTQPLEITNRSWMSLCEMKIYGNKGYLSDWNARAIRIIDLDTHTELKKINTDGKPRNMLFHGHILIVHCEESLSTEEALVVVNTDSDTCVETIKGVISIRCLTIDNNRAYAEIYSDHSLAVLDLFSGKEIKRLKFKGQHPNRTSIHQNIGYVCLDDRITRFDTDTLEILDNLRIGAQITAAAMAFSGNFMFLKTDPLSLVLYDLQEDRLRITATCENTEDISIAGLGVYVSGIRVFDVPKSKQEVDLMKAIFTLPNADLICASLFAEDENVVPEILSLRFHDEIDLATDILCTALSYDNIYARAYMYYALKYKRLGGGELAGNYGELPKQWRDHYRVFSDRETISYLRLKYGGSEEKEKKKKVRKKK